MSYAFGDSERAAQRLALVARVFEPASEAFLAAHGRPGLQREGTLAIDLGCGPGHTTRMLARALGGVRCVGIDASDAYLEAARKRATACEFVRHDVLATPWPTPPAQRVYARFLVTHLNDPERALAAFASQLAPRGRLLLDEVEWIASDAEPFRVYLGHVEAVLAAGGSELFVGPRLAALARNQGRVRANEVRELPVDPRDAAGMFALNWETLREHAAVVARTTAAERDALAASLETLRAGEGDAVGITWGLRQVALGA